MNLHWSKTREKGSLLGLKILLFCYRLLGFYLTYALMVPVMVYYYALAKNARCASGKYLAYLTANDRRSLSRFKHFLSFGEHLIDKFAVWSGKIKVDRVDFPNAKVFLRRVLLRLGSLCRSSHPSDEQSLFLVAELFFRSVRQRIGLLIVALN